MPVEGSKTQLGRNLGLDFGAYIQNRSFTRSVSISEPVPDETSCTTTSDSAISSTAYPGPSGRFASGGGGTAIQPSPSPLSSATATISPDSPLPSVTSSPFPLDLNQHPLSQSSLTSAPVEAVSSEVPASSEATQSPVNTVDSHPTGVASRSINSTELSTLLQNPDSHKTLSLLAHLVDSRLSPQWRNNFALSKATCRRSIIPAPLTTDSGDHLSLSSGVLFGTSRDETDSSSSSVRRPVPPTPSPSEEISVVKRFKPEDGSAVGAQSQLTKSRSEPRPSVACNQPVSFVSLRLATCVIRLANHFESRYHDKLGDLLEDVARLSQSANEDSESSVAVQSDTTGTSGSPAVDFNRMLFATRDRFHLVLKELFADRVNWGRVVAMLAFVRALCEHVEGPSCIDRATQAVSQSVPAVINVEATSSVQPVDPAHPSTTATDSEQPGDRESTTVSVDAVRTTSNLSSSSLSSSSTSNRLYAAHYVLWTAEFVHGPEGIWNWLSSNGGWDGLIRFEIDHGLGDPEPDRGIMGGLVEDDTVRLLRRAVTGVTTLAVGAVGLMAAIHYFSKRI